MKPTQYYKGYLLTTQQDDNGDYRVVIHAKGRPVDYTEYWSDEYTAVQDAKGRVEQWRRDGKK